MQTCTSRTLCKHRNGLQVACITRTLPSSSLGSAFTGISASAVARAGSAWLEAEAPGPKVFLEVRCSPCASRTRRTARKSRRASLLPVQLRPVQECAERLKSSHQRRSTRHARLHNWHPPPGMYGGSSPMPQLPSSKRRAAMAPRATRPACRFSELSSVPLRCSVSGLDGALQQIPHLAA